LAERRRIAIVTTGRQDWGILRSTALAMRDDARFTLGVWAGGMHLSKAFGRTVDLVRAEVPVTAELEILGDAPSPPEESARAVTNVSAAIAKETPDAIVLLGDRYETLAAGFAATMAGVPIVHLHGGEESEGAIDNAFRHALTKLSHLHLVSHEQHASRVRQMGEPPETVVVVGAAGLDNLHRADLPNRTALEAALGITLADPVVAVTLHATTLGGNESAEVAALSSAMEKVPATYVITQPNSDAGGAVIRAHWTAWAKGRKNVVVSDALGEKNYWGLLRIAAAVIGNSSSGIIEAPAAGLPVVNIGDRQRGRLRTEHVADAAPEAAAIEAALRRALGDDHRARMRNVPGHYPAGPAAPRIVEAIASWKIPKPARKKFHSLEVR